MTTNAKPSSDVANAHYYIDTIDAGGSGEIDSDGELFGTESRLYNYGNCIAAVRIASPKPGRGSTVKIEIFEKLTIQDLAMINAIAATIR